jgi:hypothetical protein
MRDRAFSLWHIKECSLKALHIIFCERRAKGRSKTVSDSLNVLQLAKCSHGITLLREPPAAQ